MTLTGPADVRLDAEACHRAVTSRDRRFDGVFYTAVRTTGIYCRPSCPARTPALANVTFHPSAAAAQAAGYRACKRCLPDATPGSPDWDVAADRGRARDAADRRRRRRPRGRRRARPAGRLHAAPPHPDPHRGARRRPAGPGPRPARADRAGADRDDRPDLRRHRVRGRLRQRPAVQRHRPRGLRRDARPSCAAGAAAPTRSDRHGDDAAGGAHAVRGHAPCWTSSPTTWCRASRSPAPGWYARTLDLPHGPGTVRLDAGRRRPTARADGVRHGRPSRCTTCATPRRPSSGPAASSTPTATRWPSTTTSPTTR